MSFLTTYLLANTAVDTEKRNVRKNDAFFAHGEKIVFWAFFTSERNKMKPFPTVSDAQLYLVGAGSKNILYTKSRKKTRNFMKPVQHFHFSSGWRVSADPSLAGL